MLRPTFKLFQIQSCDVIKLNGSIMPYISGIVTQNNYNLENYGIVADSWYLAHSSWTPCTSRHWRPLPPPHYAMLSDYSPHGAYIHGRGVFCHKVFFKVYYPPARNPRRIWGWAYKGTIYPGLAVADLRVGGGGGGAPFPFCKKTICVCKTLAKTHYMYLTISQKRAPHCLKPLSATAVKVSQSILLISPFARTAGPSGRHIIW